MTDKKTEIEAFKKLVEFTNVKGDLWQYDPITESGNLHLKLARELGYALKKGHFDNEVDKQRGLNHALEIMAYLSERPKTLTRLQLEESLVTLLLDAGASPNVSLPYYHRVFDSFVGYGKCFAALEIAKRKHFTTPGIPEQVFSVLAVRLEQQKMGKGEDFETRQRYYSDQKELVRILFQKGIYPVDHKLFERLVPFVLEDDPEFFKKVKQQTMEQLKEADTPASMFRVLRGKGKEGK